MKTKKYNLWWLLLLLATSCNSFLDVNQKGKVIPKTVEDYELMLNEFGATLVMNTIYMSPETYLPANQQRNQSIKNKNAYQWADYQYLPGENDSDWNSFYARIAVCNEIINHIDNASSITLDETLRKTVKGQAYAERAKCYFTLANLYAQPYSPQNISKPGVPLILENDIHQALPRATLGEVYDLICKDLEVARRLVPILGDPNLKMRTSKTGLLAFKSKVYLFMNQIDSAYAAIDEAFQLTPEPKLYHYEDYLVENPDMPINQNTLPQETFKNEEIIWSGSLVSNYLAVTVFYHDDFKKLFDTENDCRFLAFASKDYPLGGGFMSYPTERFYSRSPRSDAASAPEMYLLKAECLVRQGKVSEAMDELNTLRSYRYKSDADHTLSATDAADGLIKVKEERAREFAFSGLTWFDLRRYQAYGEAVPTFSRTFDGKTYTLEPGSNRYTCSIPRYVIGKNPRIEQNPR